MLELMQYLEAMATEGLKAELFLELRYYKRLKGWHSRDVIVWYSKRSPAAYIFWDSISGCLAIICVEIFVCFFVLFCGA